MSIRQGNTIIAGNPNMDKLQQQYNDFVNTVNEALNSGLSDVAKIKFGSYTGTGTYGSSNPCRLEFTFKPKIVIVAGYKTDGDGYHRMTLFYGTNKAMSIRDHLGSSNYGVNNVTWGTNSVEWYTTETGSGAPSGQLNSSSDPQKYYYIAIG